MSLQNAMVDINRFRAQVLQCAEHFQTLVSTAFGPLGKGVLIQEINGQFTITRSGLDILNSCPGPQSSDSVQRILLKHAGYVQERLGDGVKSFILILTALFSHCKTLHNPNFVSRQLSLLDMKLGELFSANQGIFLPHGSDIPVYRILETFFKSRFPIPVATVLSSLLYKLINEVCLNDNNYSFPEFLKYFPLLCVHTKDSQPLHDSYISPGFVVCRTALTHFNEGLYLVNILPFNMTESESESVYDSVDIESEVERWLCNLIHRKRELSEDVKGILLLTCSILSDMSLFHLKCSKIIVIQGIPQEEMVFIHDQVMCLQRSLYTSDVILTARPEIHQNAEVTWLGLPTRQLVLCSPTLEIGLQYSRACYSALKLVNLYLGHNFMKGIENNFPVCKAGGNFERMLCSFVSSKFKMSFTDVFEMHNIKRSLPSYSDNSDYHDIVQCVPSSAINHVTHSTFNILCDVFKEIDESVIISVCKSLSLIPRQIEMLGSVDFEGLEPLILRIEILRHVLKACASFLRVDGVIQIKKSSA